MPLGEDTCCTFITTWKLLAGPRLNLPWRPCSAGPRGIAVGCPILLPFIMPPPGLRRLVNRSGSWLLLGLSIDRHDRFDLHSPVRSGREAKTCNPIGFGSWGQGLSDSNDWSLISRPFRAYGLIFPIFHHSRLLLH